MGASDTLKDSYYSAEDAWYRLVDKISDKLPVFGSTVDKIEEKGVPTFPAFIALILIILIILFLLLASPASALIVNVVDENGEAVSGAEVTVYLDGETKGTLNTNALGTASFYLPNGFYSVKIDREGYASVTRNEVAADGTEKRFTLTDEDSTLTKAIALKNASGELINGTGTIIYSCVGESSQRYANYENGRFNADFSDCTELQIDSITGYSIVEGSVSFSEGNSVLVDEIEENTGTITVSLTSEEDTTGLKVNLYTEEGTLTKSSTSSSGVVIFENVPTDSYYVVVIDPNGNFNDYDGSQNGDIKELSTDETESFNVILSESNSSTITVTVKDAESGLPISGAEVKRTSEENQNDLETLVTGNSGQVTFNVPTGNSYLIIADHPDYIIPSSQRVSSGGIAVFDLVEASESNSQSLIVKVSDPTGDAISGTRVVLKRTDDTKVDEKVTGADGVVEFYNLEVGNYFVFADKPGFDSTTSPSVQVLPRRSTNLDVTLDIGTGIIRFNVSDSGGALSAANISAYDIEGNLVDEKTTSSEGINDFSIRVDREVYFKVSSPNLADYYTTYIMGDEGALTEIDVLMENEVSGLSVELKGIYTSGEEVEGESISVGKYYAKLILRVPNGRFNEAGVHIRTGKAEEGVTNLLEEDSIAIGNVMAATTKKTKGTTYTPSNGYSTDSKNFTSGISKWTNVIINNPDNAVYEVVAEILVQDALVNSTENFWYRAWSKGSSNLKDPASNVGGNELYSNAKNRLLNLSNTKSANLCSGSFCRIYSLETLNGRNSGRVVAINNRATLDQDNSYKLIAEIVSQKPISNSVLEIEGIGVEVDEITVNNVVYDADDQIVLGALGTDAYNKVEVEFTTNNPGSGTINFAINSLNRTEFENTVTLNINANKKFELDIIPKQIIPYTDNTMFFEITDGNNPVSKAIVEILDGSNTLGIVETNGEGLAQFELSYPTPGDEITIIAKKEGYDSIEINKTITEDILLITPNEISNTIKIGEVTSIDETIILTNRTVSDLEITRVSVDGELDTYLSVDVTGIEDTTIGTDKDANYTIKLKTNSKAQRLSEPLTIEGIINIDVKAEEVDQTFTTELPVRIRLSMPGFLDSDRCLKVSPSNIEFNTSTNEATASVEVENNCVAEGVKVNLFEVEAKLSENSKLGTVLVSGEGFTNASLSEAYKEIASIFESDSKQTLNIRFVPNASVTSGEQKFKVTLRGKNVADEDTEETVETSFNIDASMSNLNKCLEVEEPDGGLILEVAGWNLGYDRLITSNLSSYTNNYQGFNNRGRNNAPFNMGAALPFTGYGQQGPGQYEQDKFVIKNNCAVDIEVDLDPDSKINVAEETITIGKDSDATISVSPGYTLGRYSVGVNAKVAGTDDTKRKVETVSVTVRKLGEIENDCIKVNVSTLNFNSFIYKAERHKVFNYCYNSGIALDRSNNAVTVQCEAPNALTSGVPYFQSGSQFRGLYDQMYPLGGTINSYHDYLRPTSGGQNTCPMVGGTRVYDRTLNGNVEELTFEVLPSAQYLPQRKLFDNQTQTFGIFNSIIDIRQWATETDARTNIYGNLAVQYTNQYGSMQTLSFPIKIEDIWRTGESIDSAINWGDPNATPASCVSDDMRDKSLNIYEYWKDRSNTKGAIPDGEYKSDTKYTYIAEPPAVRIGPGSRTNVYPNPYNRATPNVSGGGNCGLLDSLSNFNYDNNIGGVRINIEGIKKGSLLANTLGPNVVVSIDRSNIQANCVYIDMPVTADLRRAINLQKGQVQWNLKAVVTKPGYNLDTNTPSIECLSSANAGINCTDLLRAEINKDPDADAPTLIGRVTSKYPACSQNLTSAMVDQLKNEKTSASTCSEKPSVYGFDRIDKVTLSGINSELDDYCTEKFCNTEMFTGYIYDKYIELKDLASGKTWKSETSGKLSELYKEAKTEKIGDHNYYINQNGELISRDYEIPAEIKNEINGEFITNLDTADNLGIAEMIKLLNAINNEDKDEEVFLKITNNATYQNNLSALGYLVGSNFYIPLEIYININKKLNKSTPEYDINGITLNANLMKYMAESNPKLVELVRVDATNGNSERINRVYEANPRLKRMNELATDANIYITNIDSLELPQGEIDNARFSDASGFETTINNMQGIGKYSLQIDLNYKKLNEDKLDAEINLSNYETVGKAVNNVLLTSDFKLSEAKKASNVIADKDSVYNNIPVEIEAGVHAQLEALAYSLTNYSNSGEYLIDWTFNGLNLSETKLASGKYVVSIPVGASAKTLKGTAYLPADVALNFDPVQIGEAAITANTKIIGNETRSVRLTNSNPGNIQFSINPGIENVAKVVEQVKKENACVMDGKIIYNKNKSTTTTT